MTTRAEDILDRLPHRPPFRFVSDSIEFDGADGGRAVWRVTGDEPVLSGHFPGAPIVPGVLIAEALAQLSGLIVAERRDDVCRATGYPDGKLAHMDLRFDETVVPPAAIALSSKLNRLFGTLWQFQVVASCDGRTVARGLLTLAIDDTALKASKEQV